MGVACTKAYIAGTHGTPGSSRRPAVLLQGVVMASLQPGCLDTGSWSICNATEYYLRTRVGRSLDVFSISIPGIWHAPTGTEDFHVALVAVVAVGLLLLLACVRLWARRSQQQVSLCAVREQVIYFFTIYTLDLTNMFLFCT